MVTLLDNFTVETPNGTAGVGAGDYSVARGMTFTAGVSATLYSAKFICARSAAGTGTVYAKLYEMTGSYGSTGKPSSGTELAISDGIDVATGLTTSHVETEFLFTGDNQITLTGGSHYCIAIYLNNGTCEGDGINYVSFRIQNSGFTYDGNEFQNSGNDESVWNTFTSVAILYSVYGEPIPEVTSDNMFLLF